MRLIMYEAICTVCTNMCNDAIGLDTDDIVCSDCIERLVKDFKIDKEKDNDG